MLVYGIMVLTALLTSAFVYALLALSQKKQRVEEAKTLVIPVVAIKPPNGLPQVWVPQVPMVSNVEPYVYVNNRVGPLWSQSDYFVIPVNTQEFSIMEGRCRLPKKAQLEIREFVFANRHRFSRMFYGECV